MNYSFLLSLGGYFLNGMTEKHLYLEASGRELEPTMEAMEAAGQWKKLKRHVYTETKGKKFLVHLYQKL